MSTELKGINKNDELRLDYELEKLGTRYLVAIIKNLLVINYNQSKLIAKMKNEDLLNKS